MSKETKEELLEELYKSGIRQRPTMTLAIEEVEKTCYDKCQALAEKTNKKVIALHKKCVETQDNLIKECEKETGRDYRPPAETLGFSIKGKTITFRKYQNKIHVAGYDEPKEEECPVEDRY